MSYIPLEPSEVAPATHTHAAADVVSGVLDIARVATGTPDGTLFVRDDGTLAAPPGGSGGVSDGDKGDIVVSGSGATWTIDSAVLTTAGRNLIDDADAAAQRTTLGLGTLAVRNDVRLNQAEVTGPLPFSKLTPSTVASVLLGRGGASGAGDFQEITLGTNLSMSGTTLNASGGSGTLSDGDKGDITVSGSGATWTIDNDVVTYAKMQNVTNSRVLGRVTAGSGDTEELTASQVMDFVGSTRGSVLYRGASAWSALTPGTSGYFLKSNGAGADPSYAAVALTREMVQLSVDKALSSSNTWVQACETVSAYSQGTYLLHATITFNRAATTARTYQAKLTNDQVSVANYASTQLYMPSVNPSSASLSLSAIATVPALASYKFRLWGLSTAGSASDLMKAALATNGVGNNATTLTVVKIG